MLCLLGCLIGVILSYLVIYGMAGFLTGMDIVISVRPGAVLLAAASQCSAASGYRGKRLSKNRKSFGSATGPWQRNEAAFLRMPETGTWSCSLTGSISRRRSTRHSPGACQRHYGNANREAARSLLSEITIVRKENPVIGKGIKQGKRPVYRQQGTIAPRRYTGLFYGPFVYKRQKQVIDLTAQQDMQF